MDWIEILIVVVVFFAFSLIINGLFLKFASSLGLRTAKTDGVRWTLAQKPSFGGISFYILFLLSVIAFSMVDSTSGLGRNIEFLGLLLAVSIGFVSGLFDDAFNTKPLVKLGMQVLATFVLIFSGTYIQISGELTLDYILTFIWVIGIINAINLLDNMDAIASIVVVFILSCFMAVMMLNGYSDGPYLFVSLGLIAAIGGFLFFNWNPSKLFMGDTGSMFLGTIVAFLGIKYGWNLQMESFQPTDWQKILLVLIIFIVPLTDTTTVFIKRILSGKSPFVGGKDHTTHHLSYLGLSERAVAMIYGIIGLLTVFATGKLIPLFSHWNGFLTLACVSFTGIVFFGLFYIAHLHRDKE